MNNKEENKFFKQDFQGNPNVNYSMSEQDRREYKYNNEVLPPLKQTPNGKINKFYINLKFPFLKYLIVIAVAIGLVLIIYNLPYNKLKEAQGEKYCLVILDYGNQGISSEKVPCGTTISRPEDTPTDYNFLGWYNDEELYDFSSPLNGNITLVAKWEEDGGEI